jgi:hypothetical protein
MCNFLKTSTSFLEYPCKIPVHDKEEFEAFRGGVLSEGDNIALNCR